MATRNTQYPYDTVVYLTSTVGGITYRGSGVLITPDEVLTASHLIYQVGSGISTRITAAPGYDGGTAPFGTATASWFHYNPINDALNLIANAESQNDFAVVHLDRSFGVGTMGILADYGGGSVHLTGYPVSAGSSQTDVVETVSKDPRYTLLDGPVSGAGTSGGPLWVMQDNQPGVVGLVSSGSVTTGYSIQITGSVLQQIQAWVQQDDAYDPLVDSPFYRGAYRDVAAAPMSAAFHYHTSGWHEGRNPDAFFSTSGYLGANRDVLAAGIDPVSHFDQSGWHEGRDPAANFDTTLYLLHNQDVARAGIDPLMHFLTAGRTEGRAAYAAIGTGVTAGFDAEYYLLSNPDVALSGIDPAQHFYAVGWKEGRNPDAFFDVRGYLDAYADVRAAGINPLVHYDASGWREGRDPSAGFDTRSYLRANGDVAAAAIDPLQHYLSSGAYELRATFADGAFSR